MINLSRSCLAVTKAVRSLLTSNAGCSCSRGHNSVFYSVNNNDYKRAWFWGETMHTGDVSRCFDNQLTSFAYGGHTMMKSKCCIQSCKAQACTIRAQTITNNLVLHSIYNYSTAYFKQTST